MNDILMESKILRIVKVKKKTSEKMFKDLKAGDKIKLSISVNIAGTNQNGKTFTSVITIESLKNKDRAYKNFNEIAPILDCFELEDL